MRVTLLNELSELLWSQQNLTHTATGFGSSIEHRTRHPYYFSLHLPDIRENVWMQRISPRKHFIHLQTLVLSKPFPCMANFSSKKNKKEKRLPHRLLFTAYDIWCVHDARYRDWHRYQKINTGHNGKLCSCLSLCSMNTFTFLLSLPVLVLGSVNTLIVLWQFRPSESHLTLLYADPR